MKLPSGKRLGQSGHELTLAAFFSFFLHVIVVVAALLLSSVVTPKAVFPPVYQVKLVGQLQELAPTPALPRQEAVPETAKPSPKPKKAAPKKSAMPELKKARPEPEYVAEDVAEPPRPAEKKETVAGSVAVTTPRQDFQYPYYLVTVRNKIGQNWRPPPDAKDAKARVIFTINRSGWVVDVNLDHENTSGTFGFQQAAIRAIRASNPFPRLPEGFLKQSLQFTVDLMAE